jgi:hypothetical protein
MQAIGTQWRKSSYSGHGGQDCVEAAHAPGTVLVRDTKDNEHGPVLRVALSDWRRFTATIQATGAVR